MLPFNLHFSKSKVGSSERLLSPCDLCVEWLPHWRWSSRQALFLSATLPRPALPFSSVIHLNPFWEGMPKGTCVLAAQICVSLSTFPSPFENLSTQETTSGHLTFPFLVLFQMQSGANDNINSGAVSKITVKGPLQLSTVFYKWGNWEANMLKGWQMLPTE